MTDDDEVATLLAFISGNPAYFKITNICFDVFRVWSVAEFDRIGSA